MLLMFASVIVPAFNAAKTIEPCLMALHAQTVSADAYEIIVIDDGSTDTTPAVVAQFPDVRLIRSVHRGAAAARNLGAHHAHGDVLLFTDADCEPTPDWIAQMLAPFADAKTVGAKGTYRTRQREWVARFVQLEYEEKYARMARAASIDFIDTYSAAYRRNIFLQNAGFDETFPTASVEDQEFSFRLARQKHRLVFVPNAIVFHRHVTSLATYARRKFRIGFWKVRVHRRHPGKMWRDTHTPSTLKLQIGLLALFVVTFGTGFFQSMAWLAAACIAGTFVATALPLCLFIARRDLPIVWIAPALIVLRAAALGTGFAVGIAGELGRDARLKRAFDVCGALIGLLIFSLPMLFIAIAIKLDSPGSIIFAQTRAGKNGVPFRMFKFRSMQPNAESQLDAIIGQSHLPPPVFKIPNDPRVTRIGKFLRRFSLDELPQLFNVLRGEMSLVGPRPEELPIVEKYTAGQRQRLAVKPGMTGPMQINGRGDLALDERVRLELDYIERYSLWFDVWLLLKTIPAVLRGKGAY